jgi:periplasmic protein TonB
VTDILDQRDSLRGAFFAAAALHAAVIGGLVFSSFTGHRPSFGALQAGGAAVGVQAVNTIPLIHHGAPNPVANDTESQVPQTPVVKPKERVKEQPPPPDAIPLKMRKSKQKPAPETSSRQRFRPLNELLPNQLTSATAPQVANQAFSASGSGRIGAGPHTTLGDQFAGYADQIRQIVASKWRTGDVNAQSAPTVIATFDLMRDGSVRNVQLLQRSGVTALDNSVERAIQEAAPFPPIPAAFPRSSASVEFWFELKR